MNLQVIKSTMGCDEYVLLPVSIYKELKGEIDAYLNENKDYVTFKPEDYVKNPITLARIKANLTQEELADKMGVTQAYISKIENQEEVSAKLMHKVNIALSR